MSKLTGSQMKYLYVIYNTQLKGSAIRAVDVARELCVSKASVSRMMKLLSEMELISIKSNGKIILTPTGINEGDIIHCKMTKIYSFFADYLGLEKNDARENAYSFLCGFSESCIERLAGKNWSEVKAVF